MGSISFIIQGISMKLGRYIGIGILQWGTGTFLPHRGAASEGTERIIAHS